MATSSSKSDSSATPANKLESVQKALHDFLHTPSAATPIFELIEKNAKLKREYLFLGGYTSLSSSLSAVYVVTKACTVADNTARAWMCMVVSNTGLQDVRVLSRAGRASTRERG